MRDTPYQANRALTVLHQAFNQAERWGWRSRGSNPTTHIDRYPEALGKVNVVIRKADDGTMQVRHEPVVV